MKVRGRVHKFGDDIDTDVIIPARYLNTIDPEILAEHCMEGLASGFSKKVRTGDVIVAGDNFGAGSSREHAAIAIKAAGIRLVIARSFARIFYRNAFNIGLPLLESEDTVAGCKDGDKLAAELETGRIKNFRTGGNFKALPVPEFMLQLIKDKGLIPHLKKQVRCAR